MTYVKSERQLAREQYRRSRALRSVGIAGGSSLIVVVALVVGIVSSPGWDRVRETFFSWKYAKESFPSILEGLWLNVRLLLVCGAVILAFGLLLALLRTLRGPVFFPLRALATIYTDLFRGLPVIITLLLMVYGVPALRLSGVTTNPIYLGGAALVLTYSAYVAEVFRAGIESVHPSQRAAARSLGLNWRLTMRYVVLPQAVRRVVPPLLNDLVSLQKDTGLVSIAGAVDAVYAAQIFTGQTFNYTSYVVAGAVFVALTIPMTRLTDWVTARMNRRQSQGGTV
ncbi:amino acid ABC transporter permease [Cryptosporangium aurantiacum]|uniref:Amino acid ABC transporter membrane protein, PAAT family n=1 Tax=Cryptosporangium aurantiacum TaxID=134849 RepID=A0A1M7RMY5_9ACTN|nr:amino acid ABC transporter permease [Cryptosporangium aurantiacum]SHN47432.1 amino acid ABC transporter membrane protein, PAAT family [Cryptosporangium aurantiacum]